MLRPTALLLLCACAPTVPDPERPADTGAPVDTGEPIDTGEPSDPDCDDALTVGESWSWLSEDYGAYRGHVGFDADGRHLRWSIGYYRSFERIFDTATGEEVAAEDLEDLWRLDRRGDRVVDFSPNSGTVRVRDGRDEQVFPTDGGQQFSPAVPVLLTEDALLTARCVDDGRVVVDHFWSDGTVGRSYDVDLPCRGWGPRRLAYDAEGERVLVASQDGLALIDLQGGEVRLLLEPLVTLSPPFTEVAFAPDGAAAVVDKGELRIYDTETGELIAERDVRTTTVNRNIFAPSDERAPFAWSADGRLLARGLDDDTVVIERTCDGAEIAVVDVDTTVRTVHQDEPGAPYALVFSPGGDRLILVFEGGLQGVELR